MAKKLTTKGIRVWPVVFNACEEYRSTVTLYALSRQAAEVLASEPHGAYVTDRGKIGRPTTQVVFGL